MSYIEVPQAGGEGSGVRFNGEGGVRKEWWWHAGPVDSCCFCCSLRAGVAILATKDLLLNGIYATFYQQEEAEQIFHQLHDELQENYSQACTGLKAQLQACIQEKHTIEQLEDDVMLYNHLPFTFYVQGVIAILAGIAGLVAVFNSNAMAAKLYLWTWAPRFVATVATEAIGHLRAKKYGVDQHPLIFFFVQLLNLFFVVYFIKVLWSFHNRLNQRSNPSTSPSQAVQIGQPTAGYDGV